MLDNLQLLELAKKACDNAYAKYSNFHVGACALYESGNYYLGCNVENASYGLTLCAERNAMSNAIVAGEKSKLVKIAIFSKDRTNCMPCGACRQVIHEFCDNDADVDIILEVEGALKIYTLAQLLPSSFSL